MVEDFVGWVHVLWECEYGTTTVAHRELRVISKFQIITALNKESRTLFYVE